MKCNECKIKIDDANFWYMLKHDLWKEIAKDNPRGFLCVSCLLKRLGRDLTKDDLIKVFANNPFFSVEEKHPVLLAAQRALANEQ